MDNMLVLRTDNWTATRKVAWVECIRYKEDNQVVGVSHSIYVGYKDRVGGVYQAVMQRPKLPVMTWGLVGNNTYSYGREGVC